MLSNHKNVDYNDCGVLNTIGLNRDANSFKKDAFIKLYCILYDLHASQVKILAVKAGSTIIEVYITNSIKHTIDLNKFREQAVDDEIKKKALTLIGAFCLLFDKPSKKRDWEEQQKIS